MRENTKQLMQTILKAIALAMGVAVVALSAMHKLNIDSAIPMLGIGVCCCGISLLNKD